MNHFTFWMILGIAFLILLVFYKKRYITLSAGIFLFFWFDIIVFLGQSMLLVILIGFFIVATLAKVINKKAITFRKHTKSSQQRDIIDFLPMCLSILLITICFVKDFKNEMYLLHCVISFGLADILGSEIGPIFSKKAYSIPSFKVVPHGTSGAISLAGIVFSLVGSLLGSLPLILFEFDIKYIIFVTLIGFIVAQLDTVLNTMLKGKNFWRKNELINFISCLSSIISGCFLLKM